MKFEKKFNVTVTFSIFAKDEEDAFNAVEREIQGLLIDAAQRIEFDFVVGEPEEIE